VAVATQTHDAQAAALGTAFLIALNRLGAQTVRDSLASWVEDVPVVGAARAQARWLSRAVRAVMRRRGAAARLALAYYRLLRALRTGSTVGPDAGSTTLGELRQDFISLARGIPSRVRDAAGLTDEGLSDRTPVRIERLPGFGEADERLERAAEAEIRELLNNLGLRNLQKKIQEIDPEKPATKVDEERDLAHRQAGARQAAASERVAMNGARSTVWDLAQRDRRVLGYIRVSLTGTPCDWCAMLISRGFVPKSSRYRTQESAGPTREQLESGEYGDGDKYHDNCHCYAEPVYSPGQLEDDKYALNRKYAQLWPQVTRGLSGKAARQAWRRWFYQNEKKAAKAAT
jgi:hypothetical protein